MRLQKHQLIALTAHELLVERGQATPEDFVMPAPLPKKPRNNEESQMQRALVKWFDLNARALGVHPLCLMSIPNGGNGDARRGSIMKAEGQRKGAPDLLLAVARKTLDVPTLSSLGREITYKGWYHALFLELKTASGHLSPEQEVFHEILMDRAYKVVVVRSLAQGINEITTYLTK